MLKVKGASFVKGILACFGVAASSWATPHAANSAPSRIFEQFPIMDLAIHMSLDDWASLKEDQI